MGRPLENGLPWYRHSTVQLHNPKIQCLIHLYGMAGPGTYNGLLEQISHQAPKPFVFNESQSRYLSRLMGTSASKLTKIVQSCVEVGLFSRHSWDIDRVLTTPEIEREINNTLASREEKRRNRERTNPTTNCPTNPPTNPPEVDTEAEVDTETDTEVDKAAAAAAAALYQMGTKFLGRDLTPMERLELESWDYEAATLIEAFREAAFTGGRTLKYVLSIAERLDKVAR